MLSKQDIYNYDLKVGRYLEKIKELGLSEATVKSIFSFKDHLYMRGLSKPRVLKYLEILYFLARRFGDRLPNLTKSDVEELVGYLNEKGYSPWTKQVYRVIVKKYLTWLNGDEPPESVRWLKIHFSNSERKLPGDGELLTEDEVKQAIEACTNIRDRCLLSVLYESGCRIGEIASMRIGNIQFDKYGVVVTVIGKTGSRKIRLVKSTAILKMYIESHPDRTNSSAPLWVNIGVRNHKKPMLYPNYQITIKQIFKRAGIQKRCNPHMFRHARATQMANHLTEFQMNQYFGWTQGSDMPSTYVHLSGRDVDSAVLNMNGIQEEEADKQKPKAIKCFRCEFINPHDTPYCLRCSQVLDDKTAAQHEEIQKRQVLVSTILNGLIKKPEVQEMLLKEVEAMGLGKDVLGLR